MKVVVRALVTAFALLLLPPSATAQPTSTRLAFHSDRDLGVGGNVFQIYSIKPDGTALTRLTFTGAQEGGEIWSPDGRKIAFWSHRDGPGDAYVMNSDGSNQQRLTLNAQIRGLGSYSPDGQKIAFVTDRDGNNEIYLMDADGTDQVRVTNNTADDQVPIFSPDGNKIAFISNMNGFDFDIYTMKVDGSAITRLTQNQGHCYVTSWKPDGSRIAYHAGQSGAYQVFIMDPDGGNKTQVTNAANDNSEPSWSPDGSQIAFLSSRDHAWVYNIWVMNEDGSNQHAIETENSQHYGVRWSPFCTLPVSIDGAAYVCSGDSVVLNAGAGYETYLWSTGATSQSITVTPDEATIYTVTVTSGECSGTDAHTVEVLEPNAPVISPSGSTTFCEGGSVTLTASASASYVWSPTLETTQSIVVSTSGSHSVTVTDANGCSATSDPIEIEVNSNPEATITPSGPTTFCPGSSVMLTASLGDTYLWSTGATTQSITVASSGSYAVTITSGGCTSASAPTTVTVLPATAITSFAPLAQTAKKNKPAQPIVVSASGTGTMTYQWYRGVSGDLTNPIASATAASFVASTATRGTFSYWVRARSSTCPGSFANSATATVIVE